MTLEEVKILRKNDEVYYYNRIYYFKRFDVNMGNYIKIGCTASFDETGFLVQFADITRTLEESNMKVTQNYKSHQTYKYYSTEDDIKEKKENIRKILTMKKLIVSISLIFICMSIFGQKEKQLEKYYQNLFAKSQDAITEFILTDRARVDILTDTFAIEVDFAHKWGESIGQSLFYAVMLDKKPGVLLIVDGKNDNVYLTRLMVVANQYNIRVWTIDYRTDKWKMIKPKKIPISDK